MSKDVATNTDPLDVEIYVENGLIKGRIITSINATPIIVCDTPINNTIISRSHIYTINTLRDYDFTFTNVQLITPDNIKTLLNDKYENFNYIDYMIQHDVIGPRRNVYNHYCRNKLSITIDNEYETSYIIALIKVLNLARENTQSEIMIIFLNSYPILSNINKYNIAIDDYEFTSSRMIVSPIHNLDTIIGFNNITIKSVCYEDLIESLSTFSSTWKICLLNYIDKHPFETLMLDYNLFEE